PDRGRRRDRACGGRVHPARARRSAAGDAGLVAGTALRRLRRLGRSRASDRQHGTAADGIALYPRARRACSPLHALRGGARLRVLGRVMRCPMRTVRVVAIAAVLVASASRAAGEATHDAAGFGVGAQYDTTHVYVAPADFDRFVKSFVATFGGTTSKQ